VISGLCIGQRNGPQLAAMLRIIGAGEDPVSGHGERPWRGGVAARIDVTQAYGAGGGSVTAPGLGAVLAVVGGEDDAMAGGGQHPRRGASRPGVQIDDQPGRGGGAAAHPQLGTGALGVDGEKELVAGGGETARPGGCSTHLEIVDEDRAARRAVGAPEPLAVTIRRGDEVDRVAEERQIVRLGARGARPEIGDASGPLPGAVGPPRLAAVHAVVGGEDRALAEADESIRVGRKAARGETAAIVFRGMRRAPRIDVAQEPGAGLGAVGRPELAAVDVVVRREDHEPHEPITYQDTRPRRRSARDTGAVPARVKQKEIDVFDPPGGPARAAPQLVVGAADDGDAVGSGEEKLAAESADRREGHDLARHLAGALVCAVRPPETVRKQEQARRLIRRRGKKEEAVADRCEAFRPRGVVVRRTAQAAGTGRGAVGAEEGSAVLGGPRRKDERVSQCCLGEGAGGAGVAAEVVHREGAGRRAVRPPELCRGRRVAGEENLGAGRDHLRIAAARLDSLELAGAGRGAVGLPDLDRLGVPSLDPEEGAVTVQRSEVDDEVQTVRVAAQIKNLFGRRHRSAGPPDTAVAVVLRD